MNEQMEKLVEEIARNFCICCGELSWDSGLCERTDPPTSGLCDLIKRIVPDVITLTLSAFRDGELGVVAGGEGMNRNSPTYWLRVDKECYEAQSIIALRREEDSSD